MLEKWFLNRIQTIMKHNDYREDMITTKVCNEEGKWTPCDLIAREYLNNGGGSAKGFLGISRSECNKCYDYMCENRDELIDLDYVSQEGWNNWGIKLWQDYLY